MYIHAKMINPSILFINWLGYQEPIVLSENLFFIFEMFTEFIKKKNYKGHKCLHSE